MDFICMTRLERVSALSGRPISCSSIIRSLALTKSNKNTNHNLCPREDLSIGYGLFGLKAINGLLNGRNQLPSVFS